MSGEAADMSGWMETPHLIAVDAKGYVWRAYYDDGTWSMAPVNPDNSPIPEPVTYYAPVTHKTRIELATSGNLETTWRWVCICGQSARWATRKGASYGADQHVAAAVVGGGQHGK
jgi:hypothetical protein